jgi:hypothetical protein
MFASRNSNFEKRISKREQRIKGCGEFKKIKIMINKVMSDNKKQPMKRNALGRGLGALLNDADNINTNNTPAKEEKPAVSVN